MPTPIDLNDIRTLLGSYLPQIRDHYIGTWKQLADGSNPRDRRQMSRARALSNADTYDGVVAQLLERKPQMSAEDQKNIDVLCEQITRLSTAIRRLVLLSPHAVANAQDLAPNAVGCGQRFRKPEVATSASRVTASRPSRGRDTRHSGAGRR